MAIIKRKTLKAIIKPVRKLIKKHGPEIAMAVVTSLITYMVTDDNKKTKSLQKKLKKAQKNGNFVSEAAASLVTNMVSQVLPAKTGKKIKKKGQEIKDVAMNGS